MSKVKWNISLILVVFLVGVLNTAAFAASDPYNLQMVQTDSGLAVSFTGNPAATPADGPGTQFDLVLKDGAAIIKEYAPPNYPIVLNNNFKCIFIIPSSDLTSGNIYTVELYYYSDTAHATRLSIASELYTTNSYNKKMYSVPNANLDITGSGLPNANHTGEDAQRQVKTSDPSKNQNVHGFYENNTNSCASCHQTHTAQDSNLLMKNGVYSTCSACHDGTTGAFNAFSPTNSTTPNSITGTFGVTQDVNGSLHQADGSLKITSAPGGNSDSNSTIWNQNFDCASCHSPHGGGSGNENNLNIDPLGWGSVQYVPNGTKDQQDGKLYKNINIYNLTIGDSIPTQFQQPYILVIDKVSDPSSNYFYNRAKVPNNSYVIQTYRWNGTAYIADYSLWLQEKGYPYKANTALYNDLWNNLSLSDANHYNDTSKDITRNSDVTVVWRDGFAWGPGVANVKSAQVSLGIDIETTENAQSLYDPNFTGTDSKGNQIAYIPDSGIEMTKFCIACHTDYAIDPATGNTGISGVLTAYHRHMVTAQDVSNFTVQQIQEVSGLTDQLTCVRCHFAHGTKADIMKDSSDNIPPMDTDAETLSSSTHSSALRRYNNLDSCYTSGCHTSTDSSSALYLSPTSN